MGGHALKHLSPRRLTSAEVQLMVHHLLRRWSAIHDQPFTLVPWVADKADHGDIDLVCTVAPELLMARLAAWDVDPALVSRNDRVLSIPVPLPWHAGDGPAPIAQVDCICCRPEEAVALRFYLSGGDFGLLLGRVAAWHGLVFGMDGLRYRADASVPWQRDVHLTADPARILVALGYPPRLPWFGCDRDLWAFILSSPMAGAWMFAPEATHHDNRTRDRQRPAVLRFQAWLAAQPPPVMPPRRPAPDEVRAWVASRFPEVPLAAFLARQEAEFRYQKLLTRILGMDAAAAVVGADLPAEVHGGIVRGMAQRLPPLAERIAAMATPAGWAEEVDRAHAAAAAVAAEQGLPPVASVPSRPAFVAPP